MLHAGTGNVVCFGEGTQRGTAERLTCRFTPSPPLSLSRQVHLQHRPLHRANDALRRLAGLRRWQRREGLQ